MQDCSIVSQQIVVVATTPLLYIKKLASINIS